MTQWRRQAASLDHCPSPSCGSLPNWILHEKTRAVWYIPESRVILRLSQKTHNPHQTSRCLPQRPGSAESRISGCEHSDRTMSKLSITKAA
jgi:hypothetical protein